MQAPAVVFEETYQKYLKQLAEIDLPAVGQRLGGRLSGNDILIPVFGRNHRVSRKGISDENGKLPGFDICVIVSQYLLLCPDTVPLEKEWTSFRDLRDAGPLTTYFSKEVEKAIITRFTGKPDRLKAAALSLGGYPPAIDAAYDLAVQCDALPRIPLLLLFNDAADDFPAACSVLFERRARNYLDPECLAVTGRLFYTLLGKAGNRE